MKKLFCILAVACLAACATPGTGLSPVTADRVVIDADAAFIAAATALNAADETNPALKAKGEPLRAQAYAALKAVRAAAAAGQVPSTAALLALTVQITALVNGVK